MKVYVLGMPGSGKTTLARSLAETLAVHFVDLDEQIESDSGKSIRSIFQDEGESAFRKLESRLLREWSDRKSDFVMATGGGTPCFENNIQVINRTGISIFIDVTPAEITERLSKTDLDSRPLFAGIKSENLQAAITAMRGKRVQFYHQATLRVTPEMPVEEIVNLLRMGSQR